MSLTDRDRKIVLALVPLVCVLAFWFLLMAPKREQAADAGARLAQQEQARDAATFQADQLEATKRNFASEYAELVRIGKAVPTTVDMPSLIVQLNAAANGTGIHFSKIAAGPREPALGGAAGTAGAPADPVAAGGQPAQSGAGQATEQANEAAAATDTATSTTPAGGGGLPVGGGSAPAGATTEGSGVPGLDTVPLELEFDGRFFDMAQLFHRLKRFVRVANEQIDVRGRLLTVDNLRFEVEEDAPPGVLSVEIQATIFLAPSSPAAEAPTGLTPAAAAAAGSDSDRPGGPPLAAVSR